MYFYFAGLLTKVLANVDDCHRQSIELASLIASKSPVAVQGTKIILNYSRDHSIRDSLDYAVRY